MTQDNEQDRSITISREMPFPRELVFSAFADGEHISQWWGPNGFSTTTSERDFRPGGAWRFIMHGPDGRDYENNITYGDIEPPARLTYSNRGGVKDPIAFHSTVTFDEVDGGTRVTLHLIFPTKEERDNVVKEYGAIEGGQQTLARLEAYLAAQGGAS
ncbi:MAG: ATPase [Candidatus Hydrogenedens sp.]|nr:ATPase [Candidatus Hydrogenedens sp.]